jgi:hypothetical protein
MPSTRADCPSPNATYTVDIVVSHAHLRIDGVERSLRLTSRSLELVADLLQLVEFEKRIVERVGPLQTTGTPC